MNTNLAKKQKRCNPMNMPIQVTKSIAYVFLTLFLVVIGYIGNAKAAPAHNGIYTNSSNDTKDKSEKTSTTNASLAVKTFRKFESLEKYDTKEIVKVRKPKNNHQKGFQFETKDAAESKKWLELAEKTFATIEETQNFIDQLSSDQLSQLPVGINPIRISNTKYTVGIADARFTPGYAMLTIFLKVETARGTLILGAQDVKLSNDGGIVGDARLNLISQFTINVNRGKILLTLNGSFSDPKTYATIDCNGFKELAIDADVTFSSELIFPVNDDGKRIEAQQVSGSIKTQIADWNDWVVNVSLPEFGVKGLEGTTFRLNTAVLDFSDLRNDQAVPSDYINTYYSENPLLWRGVYVESLEVVLPKAFKKNGSDKRITFTGSQMIIDEGGVTGTFTGEQVLSIDEGSASKWQFSLDFFKVGLKRNALVAGEFNGEMILPVSKVGRLQYDALIRPDEYVFNVSKTEGLSFDVWNAKVDLTPDSYVEMAIRDDKFRPKASLHGSFGISSGLGKDAEFEEDQTVQFRGIVFEQMVIQTEAPKFSVDYFGYQGNHELAKFPVSIQEVGLRLKGDAAELVVDFNVNLTSERDGGNGGGCKLAIKAKLEDDRGRERWKYDGIDLERLHIKMQVAGLELQGAIFIFEDDPTYGKGFAGAVGAVYPVGNGFEVQAKVLFGRTTEFRYWFADAQVTLPTPIPVFSMFGINSFGGGFYNHMKMAGIDRSANGAFQNIGTSTSGVVYEPSATTGFGMKASIGLILINGESVFNATVEFGISFRNSGGIQEIYFKGEGNILSSIPGNYYERLTEKLGKLSEGLETVIPSYKPEGRIAANVFIRHDFENDIFHATSELYINLGFLKGIGPNGRAGWLDFYVGPDKWHMLIGTPEDPVGTKLDIGILKMETRAYFMTGEGLPGSPPPPPIVADLLGVDSAKLDYTRDLNKLDSGKGMALGMHWAMTTGDLRFLIFYARFDAGLGFDLMLKDYGDAHCVGKDKPIGIDGWYANGQAYAYLQGRVGIKFKIFGKRKKKTIFSGSAAVLMQTRLPNPVWMRGYFRGKFRILGGLIKGSFRFKVELGNKCEVVGGSALDGIVVIGDMKPTTDSKEVDVFAAPQVAFNLPINKVFELPDDTGDHRYKIMLDKFDVSKGTNVLPGTVEWNDANDSAIFYSHDILPPKSEIKALVQVHFEEYISGQWKIIKDNGETAVEVKEIVFTTGEAPTTIPMSNVLHMYPVIGQKNLHLKEYKYGYITLRRGQPYLFEGIPDWETSMIATDAAAIEIKQAFSYSQPKKQLVYELSKELNPDTEYSLSAMLIPPSKESNNNIKQNYEKKELNSEEGNDVEIRSAAIDQLITNGEARELIGYDFKTSRYDTFRQKIGDMKKQQNLFLHLSLYELTLQQDVSIGEPFDMIDLVGNRYTENKPLIQTRAILNNTYYKKDIYPLLYQSYPLHGDIEVTRFTEAVGVPPVEGVEPITSYLTYAEEGSMSSMRNYNPFSYNLTSYFYKDYMDLRYQLVSKFQNDPFVLEQHRDLVIESFPVMRKGDYETTWQYVLPGGIKNSTPRDIKYRNPLYEE